MRRYGNFFRKTKKIIACGLMLFCMISFSGCDNLMGSKVVLTTGFLNDELFRIEDKSCMKSEFLVYLMNSQNMYVQGLGEDIFGVKVGDQTMEESIKADCLSTISQVKAMNLLAADTGIELSDAEKEQANEAAKEYFESLNADEIAGMGNITQEELALMYQEYATANKIYDYIIRDINPEISDDEARTITVEQIVLNTWTLDSMGEKVPMNTAEKNSLRSTASQILQQLHDGTDFDVLIEQYNEAEEGTVSFGKGEVDPIIEDAAFNLDNGEISGIVETEDAYVILKCISTFNREETEANKIRIVEQRKREVFGKQYNDYALGLSRIFNNELWKKIKINYSENMTTTTFFDVYQKYFQ